MMTLILEFEHKLIFYKPGILRYAMQQARTQLRAAEGRLDRHQLLSLSLKRGWAEAKAELAGLQRVQAAPPAGCHEHSQQARHGTQKVAWRSSRDTRPVHNRRDVEESAPPTALIHRQLH